MKTKNLHAILQEIEMTGNFDRLEEYTDPKKWEGMTENERMHLAGLFVLAGQDMVEQQKPGAGKYLDRAVQLMPERPEILSAAGVVLLQDPGDINIRVLRKAYELLQKSFKMNPECCDTRFSFLQALTNLGVKEQDPDYLQRADKLYEESEQFLEHEDPDGRRLFYWRWTNTLQAMGELSGEAIEYIRAVEKCKKAEEEGEDSAFFLINYGQVLTALGMLVGDIEYFEQAIVCYEKAFRMDPTQNHALHNLALAAHEIFAETESVSDFTRAKRPLVLALENDPQDLSSLLQAGKLFLRGGKIFDDEDLIERSLSWFEQAAELAPDNSYCLMMWSEALALKGGMTEELDLLKEAEKKIQECLIQQPCDPDAWYIYGYCLLELGKYFEDAAYFSEAIEKFTTGLCHDEEDHQLWYGMALAKSELWLLQKDQKVLQENVMCCEKAVEKSQGYIANYWHVWGTALLRLGNLTNSGEMIKLAIEKCGQAIDMQGGIDKANLEWVYNYGCAHDFLGEFDEDEKAYSKAIEILEKLVERDRLNTHVVFNLALALFHLGELTADLELLHRSAQVFGGLADQDNEDEEVYLSWGITLMSIAHLVDDTHQPEKGRELLEEAESKLMHAVTLGNVEAFYHLACLYSLSECYEAAMEFFKRSAHADALPPLDDIMNDEWLEGLRETESFRQFLAQNISES